MRFKGVLFDWRGTLFHDIDDAEWVRRAAASIGRKLAPDEVAQLNKAITSAAQDPEVAAALQRHDASVEAHRAAELLQFRKAGLDEELAVAIYELDGTLEVSLPYPDTGPVLRRLRTLGIRIAVVSDINFDLRPSFGHYGLDGCIDAYALSFEHGWVKPEAAAFQTALDMLRLEPRDVLMVGDNPRRDSGAAAVGITPLILPPVPNYSVRGLDVILGILEAR